MEQKEERRFWRRGKEPVIFLVLFLGFFSLFAGPMGLINMLNTMMNTAHDLLMNTVFYLMAICVMAGALSALLTEFGVVAAVNRLLSPLLGPVYDLPGAASLGIVTTFLSDNPAILTLAHDRGFRKYFRRYQLPALTNLGTSFGMGLIVCTYMLSLQAVTGESYGKAVLVGLAGTVVGSIVSTRLMLRATKKVYGAEDWVEEAPGEEGSAAPVPERRSGSVGARLMDAMLDGGKSGVEMGLAIIPGVLIICTFVMMLTNGPGEGGIYTGGAYEGVALLPRLAEKARFILAPLFGFSSNEAVAVPVTALGAAGAAVGLVGKLAGQGLVSGNDVAVFTAMCMCWSGYLSTHVSMMNSLECNHLVGKAIGSHTVGGLCAGVFSHWLYALLSLI